MLRNHYRAADPCSEAWGPRLYSPRRLSRVIGCGYRSSRLLLAKPVVASLGELQHPAPGAITAEDAAQDHQGVVAREGQLERVQPTDSCLPDLYGFSGGVLAEMPACHRWRCSPPATDP